MAGSDIMDSWSCEGRRVVVTAGAAGIGRAMVDAFCAAGATVHVADLPGGGDGLPDGVGFTGADVADQTDVDRLFEEAAVTMGGVDVLCNNVGVSGPTGPIEELEVADWDETMSVNVRSMFLCCRRAVPLMREAGGGSIINTSSTAGQVGYPLRAPYAVSKWAVVGLGATLAMELGEFGIRTNTICPGSVGGDRMDRVVAAEAAALGVGESEVRNRYQDQVSMRTFVDGRDIAAMAVFLASAAARYVNGQVIAVDGGLETLRTGFRT